MPPKIIFKSINALMSSRSVKQLDDNTFRNVVKFALSCCLPRAELIKNPYNIYQNTYSAEA